MRLLGLNESSDNYRAQGIDIGKGRPGLQQVGNGFEERETIVGFERYARINSRSVRAVQ